MHSAQTAEEIAHHVVPVPVYLAVFAALMIGTAVTVWIAFYDFGPMNTVAALGIAFAKASLVVLYFMHVRYSPPLTWLVLSGGILWLAILIAFTLSDFYTRGWMPVVGF